MHYSSRGWRIDALFIPWRENRLEDDSSFFIDPEPYPTLVTRVMHYVCTTLCTTRTAVPGYSGDNIP